MDPKSPEASPKKRRAEVGIEQIDALQMPKRSESRRLVYAGEGLRCELRLAEAGPGYPMVVVDLSMGGVALVDAKGQFKAQVGAKVFLHFKSPAGAHQAKSYVLRAHIGHVSKGLWSGQSCERVGVSFQLLAYHNQESFLASLPGGPVFPCQGAVRPQAHGWDPFFYKEVLVFQVNGFTPQGMDVSVSARCKSLFPGQPLSLQVYMPGRGMYGVEVKLTERFWKTHNTYRLFFAYVDPTPEWLEVVSAYLVMFTPQATPKALRQAGMRVGDLSLACTLKGGRFGAEALRKYKLQPTVLGISPSLGTSDSPQGDDFFKSLPSGLRGFLCQLGSHVVGGFGVVFIDAKQSRSVLRPQLQISQVMADKRMEIVWCYLSPEVMLVDVFLQLLRHWVRLAHDGGAQILWLEASGEVLPSLKKVGFKPVMQDNSVPSSSKAAVSQSPASKPVFLWEGYLHEFLTKGALTEAVWSKVYKELSEFLRRRS